MLQCTGEVQLGQTTIYNCESECLIVVGQMLPLDSQYQIFSCERWNTQNELSSYLIISTMMMITGSRMISPTSTTTTAAIVTDPPPDTKTVKLTLHSVSYPSM